MELHPTPGSSGNNFIKCTKADVRLRTPDDWQKGCPRHVRVVIPIKIGIQCICWFYSQGICYYARSYDRKNAGTQLTVTWRPVC